MKLLGPEAASIRHRSLRSGHVAPELRPFGSNPGAAAAFNGQTEGLPYGGMRRQ